MSKYLYAFFGLAIAASGVCKEPELPEIPAAPWFTGPLFCPSAHVIPPGTINMEPYYFCSYTNKVYDAEWKKSRVQTFWTNTVQTYVMVGITDWVDFVITPSFYYSRSKGVGTFNLNDLTVGIDIQLLKDELDNYLPALKLGLRELFPITKFEHLKLRKYGTDAAGLGTFQTTVYLAASRLFHLAVDRWLEVRLAVDYYVSSRVHVRSYNTYGGAADTDALVYPPQGFDVDFAFELNLTKNWVLACDGILQYSAARKIGGYWGTLLNFSASTPNLVVGTMADLSGGSSINFSIAPAIEYNWSEDIGLITGVWCSIAGRNSAVYAVWSTGLNLNF